MFTTIGATIFVFFGDRGEGSVYWPLLPPSGNPYTRKLSMVLCITGGEGGDSFRF